MRRREFVRDWVMWDNRRVMHQVNADCDMNEHRYLYWLMLKGEVPVCRRTRIDGGCEYPRLRPTVGPFRRMSAVHVRAAQSEG
jgi:hypothetical protein